VLLLYSRQFTNRLVTKRKGKVVGYNILGTTKKSMHTSFNFIKINHYKSPSQQQYLENNKMTFTLAQKHEKLQLLREHRAANVIIEAIDKDDLHRASQIIDKLRGIKGKGIGFLDDAIDKAISELNKYTAGGPLTKAWTAIKGKMGIDNPLVKMMTFANTLETGFGQLPQIIKNNVGELSKDQAETSLNDVITDDQVRTTVTQSIVKALSASGIFGVFKKIPYISDKNLLAADMMNVPLKNLNAVARQVMSGPKSDTLGADMKDVVTAHGGAQTTNTAPSGVSTSTNPTNATSTTHSTTQPVGTAPTGEKPFRKKKNDFDNVYKKAEPILKNLGVQDIESVMSALHDAGLLNTD
jgi:hypothetical protein